ncbi:hypothetical protein T492DRAFT_839821 [Pavlovales sp. CCMP2436]|nr:hypothetical protein T492DRAFT_839821 [Pavlovales sp. CCMP2436]
MARSGPTTVNDSGRDTIGDVRAPARSSPVRIKPKLAAAGQKRVLRGSLLVRDEAHPYHRDARKQMLGKPHERSRIAGWSPAAPSSHLDHALHRSHLSSRVEVSGRRGARAWMWRAPRACVCACSRSARWPREPPPRACVAVVRELHLGTSRATPPAARAEAARAEAARALPAPEVIPLDLTIRWSDR